MNSIKETISAMLRLASDEENFDLASSISDLMWQLEFSDDSNLQTICDDLQKEFKDDEWLSESIEAWGAVPF